MTKYKVCVYAISRNEEQFVDRWMDSAEEADIVVVLDTGSSDRTIEMLKMRGASVYDGKIYPWRFDEARNHALRQVPKDVDICVSNNIDEFFEPGWRQKLESAWDTEYTTARCLFIESLDTNGSVQKQYPVEKIHRRHGFRWVHPVHEFLEYTGEDEEKSIWINGIALHHYQTFENQPYPYLTLLELSVKENPADDRSMFWLGREYVRYGKYDLGIETLKKYLALPSAKWNEERSASMRFIARCYKEKQDMQEAKSWLFRALAECPTIREPYLELAKIGYEEKDWPLVFTMAQHGLSVTEKNESYLMEPESWGYALYDFGAKGAYNLGLYEEARAYAAWACKLSPNDERLKSNLALIEEKLSGPPEKEEGL